MRRIFTRVRFDHIGKTGITVALLGVLTWYPGTLLVETGYGFGEWLRRLGMIALAIGLFLTSFYLFTAACLTVSDLRRGRSPFSVIAFVEIIGSLLLASVSFCFGSIILLGALR